MEIRLKEDFLNRWKKYFGGAELPITCRYTDDEGAADRAEPTQGHRCFLADLAKIRKGEILRFDIATIGCSGGKRYLGFTKDVLPNFEHFLSCGIPGILEGERYKKSPELVKEYRSCLKGFPIRTDYRIALTARESTPPNPMITVSNNNQTIGVILDFMRHLLNGFVCRQTDMHTVYNKRSQKASGLGGSVTFPVKLSGR